MSQSQEWLWLDTFRALEVMRHSVVWMLLAGGLWGLDVCFVLAVLSNTSCIFPFSYLDGIHFSCTSIHSDYDWCSLDSTFRGRWRYCTAKDPPVCVFPFTYKKWCFRQCTKKGYVLGRSWCSLTHNFNKDRKWKQCSPQHT
ncbi:binder of sperm protein homolog 2-like [Dipodomys merriami]|uniref:binder of sperm protein homolog 2-like n=1 Tax=Dipodomys merriami TaxID=94247 RepID=UPI00384D3207